MNDKKPAEYTVESIQLSSERLPTPVELGKVVSDIDIYEHLDKPYLTGTIGFIDNLRIYENADLLGGEKVTIKLKSIRKDAKAITNHFYIKKIAFDRKVNENEQLVILHLVEDIGFISNLQNINKSYTGKVSKIVEKISSEYLDTDFEITGEDKQNVKVIVPNMHPIEAIKWLTQRATTINGYPFYTFSTMAFQKLYMVDLGSMLEAPVINPNIAYKYDTTTNNTGSKTAKRRVIKGYQFGADAEDLSKLIDKGLVGAKYKFLDTFQDYSGQREFDFDIIKDVAIPMLDAGIIDDQPNFPYSNAYLHNEKPFNKYQSNTISLIRSSGAYRESEELERTKSYGETSLESEYKLEVISRTMDNILKKNVLTIIVPGLDFIDGDKHSTIGNKIRVEFPHTKADGKKSEKRIDAKKSGNYLIYAVRHQFKKEKYDAILSLVKIGNVRR